VLVLIGEDHGRPVSRDLPEAVQNRAPGPETNGINHFCLIVDNIENIVRQLADKGITLYLPLKTGADNNRQAWIQDPDGNRIELMEMVPDALQFKAIKEMHTVAAVNQ
jgi:lactoylglutathione lyase